MIDKLRTIVADIRRAALPLKEFNARLDAEVFLGCVPADELTRLAKELDAPQHTTLFENNPPEAIDGFNVVVDGVAVRAQLYPPRELTSSELVELREHGKASPPSLTLRTVK